MLSNTQVEDRFRNIAGVSYVAVEGDGHHYHITLVSDLFLGKSMLQRQQWVYAQLKEDITSGRLHAINMNTLTKGEWETQGG